MQTNHRFGRFEIRSAERLLLVDGTAAVVGARAFDVLLCLIERQDRVVTKAELMDRVWPGLVVEENNLTVQVSALRKLLGPKGISTVPGRGYRLTLCSEADILEPVNSIRDAKTAQATIAVLPFRVLSDDSRLRFVADGLVEDVTALLARVPGFLVISDGSSFIFRDHGLARQSVASQLNVRYLVDGSIRADNTSLRISWQLIDAQSERMLSSGYHSCLFDQAFLVQEAIVYSILSELEPALTKAEIAHIQRQRPENLDAWAYYHQAVGAIAMGGWGAAAMAQAMAYLKSSTTADPAFGLGHAHHALLVGLAKHLGQLPGDSPQLQQALSSAHRAMEIDGGSPKVLGYAGCALCDLGQHALGIEVLNQALELDPSNAQAHVALGAALVMTGEPAAGIEKMRLGMRISPRDRRLGFWGWVLGLSLLKVKRLDDALLEAQTAGRRDTQFSLPRILQAAVLDQQGRVAEATAALVLTRQLHPELTLGDVVATHGRYVGTRMALIWDASNG